MEHQLVETCVAVFWAIVGCVCSFLCPFFLGQDDWPAIGDMSIVRAVMMLVSCTAAAWVYRAGYARRPRDITRAVLRDAFIPCCFLCTLFFVFVIRDRLPNNVGLMLLSVAVYVLLEMARPIPQIYLIFCLYCAYLPVIADVLRDGWGCRYLTQPVLLFQPVLTFSICWKVIQFLKGMGKTEKQVGA